MNRSLAYLPLLVATALAATGLGVGFILDDAYQILIIEGEETPVADGNLYAFATGNAVVTQAFIETGFYPWWTLPELRIVFFRPLSDIITRMDHTLFGRLAVFWHIHAIVWYLALVLLWMLIARRILSGTVAGLAVLVFAIDDCHWSPAVFLANRNTLIACVPALFGLFAHLRWREDKWRPGLPFSVTAYGIGMLGGEAWLGVVAYVAAYELFGRTDEIKQRAISLVPAATCVISYAFTYKTLELGVSGSGAYVDPLSALYFKEAPGRIVALLGGLLFLGSPVDAWGFFPKWRWVLVSVGITAILLIGTLLRCCWAAVDPSDRRALRWLIPGGLFSLAPVIAAFPMSRQLLAPSIAASAVVAVLIGHWWSTRRRGLVRPSGVACWLLVILHLVAAPLAWPLQSVIVMGINRAAERTYAMESFDDTNLVQQDVYLLAAFDPVTQIYTAMLRQVSGRPMPKSWHVLSTSPSDHIFARTAPNAFELEAKNGVLVQGFFADMLRGPGSPFKAGDAVQLRDARLTVLAVQDGKPQRIRVEFDRDLEDPSLLFLVWENFALNTFRLPTIGESREVRYFGE